MIRRLTASKIFNAWIRVSLWGRLEAHFAGAPKTLTENRHYLRRVKREQEVTKSSHETVHLRFSGLGIGSELETYLQSLEIHAPTSIQAKVISILLKEPNKSLFVGSQTGSGKTLAYLLPIFELLKRKEKEMGIPKGTSMSLRPKAMIICPSKELVHQVSGIAKEISHHCRLKVAKLCSDQEFRQERERLEEGVDIVVGTLSRIEQHIGKKSLFTSQVEVMVFDEADALLDAGNQEMLGHFMRIVTNPEVIEKRGNAARAIFVSATLGGSLKQFFNTVFGSENSPNFEKIIDSGTHLNLANIRHDFIHLPEFDKHKTFEGVVKDLQASLKKKKTKAIIFCDSVKSAQSTEHFMQQLGVTSVSLHGDVPARLRVQNYDRFQRGDVSFLVATDLGSRGLDFKKVSHVVNFDFPNNPADYLHRVGRTGRAGETGTAISLYRNKDLPLVNKLRESYEKGVPLLVSTSSFGKLNKESLSRSKKELTQEGQMASRSLENQRSVLGRARSLALRQSRELEKPKELPKINNFKKKPHSKLYRAEREVKADIKRVPKSLRHQRQNHMRSLAKRLRSIARDRVKEKKDK